MFEQETEQLMTLIHAVTIGDMKSIGLRAIFESPIPANVKKFFKAEVEWMLAEEQRTEKKSTRFPYDDKDIVALQNQINTLLVHKYIFAKSDFDATLDKCVHFLFNFLCRPQWTLLSFLCESKNSVPAPVLRQKLRYCRDYSYFVNIVGRYIEQKKISELNYEQLQSLLAKVDHEITQSHSIEQLSEMTAPIFEFVDYARGSGYDLTIRTVPVRALMYFFEDKGMSAIGDAIRSLRDKEGVREITRTQLTELLRKLRGDEDEAAPPPPPPTITINKPESTEVFGEDDEPLPYVPEVVPEPHHPKPIPPVFSIEEERAIIKTIFNRDEALFRQTVGDILKASAWVDAALIIDRYFTINEIEPFSKEAITFTNNLQNRLTAH